nr:MAG TPA: hypothetical protein [Caudoviricetes sp.]
MPAEGKDEKQCLDSICSYFTSRLLICVRTERKRKRKAAKKILLPHMFPAAKLQPSNTPATTANASKKSVHSPTMTDL